MLIDKMLAMRRTRVCKVYTSRGCIPDACNILTCTHAAHMRGDRFRHFHSSTNVCLLGCGVIRRYPRPEGTSICVTPCGNRSATCSSVRCGDTCEIVSTGVREKAVSRRRGPRPGKRGTKTQRERQDQRPRPRQRQRQRQERKRRWEQRQRQ